MTVSVIVPAYNIAPYLEKCVNSILAQTYKDIQLILVNDGSTDGTGEICDRLAKQDNRILVIHKENGGVSSARNSALRVATGKYVSFIDGDDYIEPTLYEDAVSAMQQNNADCFMFEYFIDDEKGCRIHSVEQSKYGVISGEKAFEYSIGKENRFLTHKLYTRELLNGLFFDENIILGEDTLFVCEALLNAKQVVYTSKAYYHYIIRAGSAVQSPFKRKKLSGVVAYQKVLKMAEENNIDNAVIVAKDSIANLAFQLVRKIYQGPKYPERKQDLKYLKRVILEHAKALKKSKLISSKTKLKLFITSISVGLIRFI